jgi:hypothetical protein
MSSSPEVKGFNSKAKEAEYQALWQTCDRALRKGDYIYADRETKRNMLYAACRIRLEKRYIHQFIMTCLLNSINP